MKGRFDRVNTRIRLTQGLRKALIEAAEKNQRSFNSEIIYRLANSFGEQGAAFINRHEEVEQDIKQALEDIVSKMLRRRGVE